MRNEVKNIFSQTEFDTSPSTEVSLERNLSTPQGHFGKPENFLNHPATHCFSLKFDADDEFSSMNIDTFHVRYAHIEYH